MAVIVDDQSLRDRVRVFADRTHAGDVLADLVARCNVAADVVLAIPAGGVPVAVELSRVLHVPLDVAVVSKITLPWDTESACGAVAWDGRSAIDEAFVARVGLTDEELDERLAHAQQRVARRVRRFRPEGPLRLEGRDVLLVDDGLASGATLGLAVVAARAAGAGSVTVAAPTALRSAAQELASAVDGLLVANLRRGPHYSVADAYRTWEDVSEDEALTQVQAARGASAT